MPENKINPDKSKSVKKFPKKDSSKDPFDRLTFPGNKKKGDDAYTDITKVIRQWLSQDEE